MTKKIIFSLFCLFALASAGSNDTMTGSMDSMANMANMANMTGMAGTAGMTDNSTMPGMPGTPGMDADDSTPLTTGASSRGSPTFYPAFTFKVKQLFGVLWYEAFYADNQFGLLEACTRIQFTPLDSNTIAYQYGYLEPGLKGQFMSSTLTLKKKKGVAGQFNIITPGERGSLFVLDYAPDYSWIVIGDSNSNFLSVLSKTPMNQAGLQRALELAEEYELNSHHLELQDTQCPYTKIQNKLNKALNNL